MKTRDFFIGFVLIALGAVFFSCGNEDHSVSGNNDLGKKELVPVSFAVDFTKDVMEFRSDVAINLKDLLYRVYNTETGDLYKNLQINDFTGVINDSLPEGNYTIVFAGDKGQSVLFENDPMSIGNILPKYTDIRCPSFRCWSMSTQDAFNDNNGLDVFFKKFNCLVEKDKLNDNTVVLDRIIGKIEIVIEDIIPSDVSQIQINVSGIDVVNRNYYYSLQGDFTMPGFTINTINITDAEKEEAGYTLSFKSFENMNFDQSRRTVSITITALNGGKTVASKIINDVDILKNKTVRYTGKLFDNIITPPGNSNPSQSFPVSMNDEWGETIDRTF